MYTIYASSSCIFRQNSYPNSGHSGSRPTEIAWRWTEIVQELWPTWDQWHREESIPAEQRTRGAMLRTALSRLGPVFVKIGQTLSERPDLIGAWAESSCQNTETDTGGRSHIGCSFIFIPSLYAFPLCSPDVCPMKAVKVSDISNTSPVSLLSEGSLESFSWTCCCFFMKAYLSAALSHLSLFKTRLCHPPSLLFHR